MLTAQLAATNLLLLLLQLDCAPGGGCGSGSQLTAVDYTLLSSVHLESNYVSIFYIPVTRAGTALSGPELCLRVQLVIGQI